jgi:ABC-type antimicrobial peptide transport system permease subunit
MPLPIEIILYAIVAVPLVGIVIGVVVFVMTAIKDRRRQKPPSS